jgi:hypothetical protein
MVSFHVPQTKSESQTQTVTTRNETTADNLTKGVTFSFHSPAVRKVLVFSDTFLFA